MRMKPINLYRSDGDREVWERAQRDADSAGVSLSAHVVAVLRSEQEHEDKVADDAGWSSTSGPVVTASTPPKGTASQ
jgi:hypothetical protein